MSAYLTYSPKGTGGGGGGVTTINSLSGPLTIAAGTGISVTDNGSNTITITNTGAGAFHTEYRTISSGEASAKQLTLAATPTNFVGMDIISGCAQQLSVDFSVTTNVLSWSGLALDGILTAGDVLRIEYFA